MTQSCPGPSAAQGDAPRAGNGTGHASMIPDTRRRSDFQTARQANAPPPLFFGRPGVGRIPCPLWTGLVAPAQGLGGVVPPHNARGVARREGAAFGLSAHLLFEGAAPFGAPPGLLSSGLICGVFTAVPGRALPAERCAPSSAAISRRLSGQPLLRRHRTLRRVRRQPAPGRPPDSGAGRSPGTARVRGERSPAPAGAAPASQTAGFPGREALEG